MGTKYVHHCSIAVGRPKNTCVHIHTHTYNVYIMGIIYIHIYSWPLNNEGLNFKGPLIRIFFSRVNTTLLHGLWLVQSSDALIQKADYKLYID